MLTVFWLGMVYPTVYLWAESIKYLVFISVYTIIISHVTAALAARADEHNGGNMAGTPDTPTPEPQPEPRPQPQRPDDDN